MVGSASAERCSSFSCSNRFVDALAAGVVDFGLFGSHAYEAGALESSFSSARRLSISWRMRSRASAELGLFGKFILWKFLTDTICSYSVKPKVSLSD
jgi:hypothetical protein